MVAKRGIKPVASYHARYKIHVPGIENRGGYSGGIVPGIFFGPILALKIANGKTLITAPFE